MGQQTTAIAERVVYAQPTEPNDERDGVLWVDTSVSPRETFVYSTDSGSWEAVANEINYTAVTLEEITQSVPAGGSDTLTATVPERPYHRAQLEITGNMSTSFELRLDGTVVESGSAQDTTISVNPYFQPLGRLDEVFLDTTNQGFGSSYDAIMRLSWFDPVA